ncbi:MAG: ABC transporter ATP-binding protein [Planctomycetes bacterium]|nr:ABC transporter ATP-binding protein [Planctomycetota bacterium]
MPMDSPRETRRKDIWEQERGEEHISFFQAFRLYADFYLPHKLRILWILFFNLLIAVPMLVVPVFVKIIVDHFIPQSNKFSIYMMILVVFIISLGHLLFLIAFRVSFTNMVKTISMDIRDRIVRRLQILSLSYFYSKETGRFYSKIMRDVDRTEEFSNVFVQYIFRGLVMLVMMLAVLAWVNLTLLGILLLTFPVFYFIFSLTKRRMRESRHEERKAHENLSVTVSNFLQTSLLARQHGHEGFERDKVITSGERVIDKSTDAIAHIALFGSINFTVTQVFNFSVIAFAAAAVIDHKLTLGEMLLFVQYIQQIMSHFVTIISQIPTITEFAESVRSIREILTVPDLEHNQGKREITSLRGEVTFENVSFAYHQGQPVIIDVNVHIEPGTTVGLVGKSGAGKSTFVNLLLGLYRTDLGNIMIDDMPVQDIDMRSVRRRVGVVNQSPILFSGTIYDNIVHAYQDKNMEDVIAAAKKANAHEFIIQQPKGYDTWVGEGGVLLSGGQQQRVSLARTILRQPAILILDEATSALDSESERLVQSALDRMMGQMTTFIIAHRLSTVQKADLILVFEEGRIVETGTHKELIGRGGAYANLVKFQAMDLEGEVLHNHE